MSNPRIRRMLRWDKYKLPFEDGRVSLTQCFKTTLLNHSSVLYFMDDKGLRFHLPAYMRFALRRYRESDSMSTDSTIYKLCNPDCIKSLLAFLTTPQIDAIQTFLTTCLEIGDDWLDVSDVSLALRQWRGDEGAAEQLQAVQAAKLAAAKQPPAIWSSALVMAGGVAVFFAMGLVMYFRLRQHGRWWLVGASAIAIAFVAFLLELRGQDKGAR